MAVGITSIDCMIGRSAQRPVLIGFASASLLHALSFADVLDEDTGRGYQRRFNSRHSLDFRKYIQRESSATIPLTFNLRPSPCWKIINVGTNCARLEITSPRTKVFAQV